MRALAIVIVASALVGACDRGGERLYEERVLAMGTWVDLTVDIPDAGDRARVLREIESILRPFERDYYAWADDGELARLNRAIAQQQPTQVTPEFAALLVTAQRISERSNGAFEPAIGELVELWGFHTDAGRAAAQPPNAGSIERWLQRAPSIRNLAIDQDGTVRPVGGSTALLDLGGIAKGEAVDRILRVLRANSVTNALVNAGGDLRVLGSRAGRPWRIGVQAPRGEGLLGIIELRDGEAAFTSGDYERYYDYAGRRMHHILDPSTGYPVDHTQAVTVIGTDGATADAAATAVLVAGPEHWRGTAAALGIALVLRVDASGRLEATPQMRERLQTDALTGSDILVVSP